MNSDDDVQRGDLTVGQWREYARLAKAHGKPVADAYLHTIRRAAYAKARLRIQDTRMSSQSAALFTFFGQLFKASFIVLPCTAILGLAGFYTSGGIALGVALTYAAGAWVDRRIL